MSERLYVFIRCRDASLRTEFGTAVEAPPAFPTFLMDFREIVFTAPLPWWWRETPTSRVFLETARRSPQPAILWVQSHPRCAPLQRRRSARACKLPASESCRPKLYSGELNPRHRPWKPLSAPWSRREHQPR